MLHENQADNLVPLDYMTHQPFCALEPSLAKPYDLLQLFLGNV